MAESNSPSALPEIPQAVAEEKRKRKVPLIWLVPLVAVLAGGWLAVKTVLERGPSVNVTFSTGEGIEAGKTKAKHKSVEIGVVEAVELAPDHSKVNVRLRMRKSAADVLVEDTRFWVERPRITGTTVEGLGTLLSGAYIGIDVGKSGAKKNTFVGLEKAPVIAGDRPGRFFSLRSGEIGSLDAGSPVYYLRIPVGQVVSHEMAKDAKGVNIRVFINAPYDQQVNSQTRFWEASGISLELSANGARLETQSLNSILAGGIAFQTRGDPKGSQPVKDNAEFTLFKRREAALAFEDLEVVPFRFRFAQSVRGLSVGAPVDFRGIQVGEVKRLGAELEPKKKLVQMIVDVEFYPERFRRMRAEKEFKVLSPRETIDPLVAGGLRGQLRTGSLLSGQLYVAVDFFKDAKPAKVAWNETPPSIPTVPGTFSEIEDAITDIAAKLRKLPYEQIAGDVRQTLKTLDTTLEAATKVAKRLDQETAPEVAATLADLRKALATADRALAKVDGVLADDSPVQQDLRETLREASRAAAATRVLLEQIEQRPEALIRGKAGE